MWIVGRRGDELLIAGRAIMVSDVWERVESLPELSDGMFQIVYAGESPQLTIRLGYAPERTGDIEELRLRASRKLQEGLGVPIDAKMVDADELLATSKSVAKFSRVVKA
jgi:phenylacetate-CoA ligase